jgi:hypothetical protein
MAASPAQACRFRRPPPDNSPNAGLYRDLDAGLVIATVINGGPAPDARLRIDDVVYGRFAGSPLMLGWTGDPQYSYVSDAIQEQPDGSIIMGGCGYIQQEPVVEAGQQVLARLGVTQAGAQVVVRWWPLKDVRREPRIAAYLRARMPVERQCLGAALRPYPPSLYMWIVPQPAEVNALVRQCRRHSPPGRPS